MFAPADPNSPFGVLGTTLGRNVAQTVQNSHGGTLLPGQPVTSEQREYLDKSTEGPARDLVDAYVGQRGVLGLEDANKEMLRYIDYLKQKKPGQVAILTNLVKNEAPIFAKKNGIDDMSATGILMVSAPISDPQHPDGDELLRMSVGLDLYSAARLAAKNNNG